MTQKYLRIDGIQIGSVPLTATGNTIATGGPIDLANSTIAWESVTSKPNFSNIALSGSYDDLSDVPTLVQSLLITDANLQVTFNDATTTNLGSVIGYTGSQGITGYTGSQGDTGYTGSQGEKGIVSQATEPTDTGILWLDTSVAGAIGGSGFSGNYNDLTNKPSIPANTSDLNNDSGFITSNVSVDIVPTVDNAIDLGSPTNRFRHLYVAPGTIYLGDIKLTNLNGKLDAKKVRNPGEEDEEEDTEYEGGSDAFSSVKELELNELTNVAISNPQHGQALVWDSNIGKWKNQTAGQQYGYINQFVHSTTENVDMEAVAMDSNGNSYVSYSYYDQNENRRFGGIIKLNSTGSVQWNQNLQSSNTNGEYPQIASLEHVTVNETDFLVAIGTYYDTNISKDRGFMWIVNPADGSVGSEFNTETSGDVPVRLTDAVFGLDSNNFPFAVIVGDTYNEILPKTFTPLAGSGTDKIVVSWAEFNASGLQAGDWVHYNVVGGSYGLRLNFFDVVANLDGNPTTGGVNIQVNINQNGTYSIVRASGWSGVIYGWGNPVNVRVLGSYLGGADGVNDLTFDLNATALDANTTNVAGWATNVQGTPIGDAVGIGWGGQDWSTEVGNPLTFEYRLNRQAYIARLGANVWAMSLGGTEYEQLNTVVTDSNGNSYVGGYYWNGSKASLIAKFDIDGNQQWAVHIDPPVDIGNAVMSIDLLADGNVIAVDEEGIVTKLNSGDGSIIWQVRVDPNNNVSWNSDFKGTATPDGNYIITNYEDNDYTMYVMCVSGVDGSEVWSKRITRNFAGSNGEIYPQDDFDAQYIDCNTTSVTIAASTYLYFNNNSTNAGLVINFPVTGENADGVYGQYIIESATPGWSTETTTSTSANISTQITPVTTSSVAPTTSTNTFTMTENIIGEVSGPILGSITFDGSRLSSPATNSGDFPNGVITLAPGNASDSNYASNGQFINIYPTNAYDAPHIHIAPGTGSNGTGDLILGTDNYHIDVNHNGSIYIKTNNQNYSWEFDSNGNLRLPSGGDIKDSSGNSVLSGGSLPRDAVNNVNTPDLTVGDIRVIMTAGVITVRHATGSNLNLIYSGRTVSAAGTTTILSTGGTSVNSGEFLTLATLANQGDSMILDYLYDANTSYVYRVTVFVSWSSLPYGSIIIERIA